MNCSECKWLLPVFDSKGRVHHLCINADAKDSMDEVGRSGGCDDGVGAEDFVYEKKGEGLQA